MTTTHQLTAARSSELRQSGTTRLTILHVTAPASVGGLESVVLSLATGHRDLGHDVHVAAVLSESDRDNVFLTRLTAAGIHVHPIVLATRAYSAERAFIAELCRTIAADVVHTHGFRSDVIDGAVARRLSIPTVSTVHGFTRTTLRGKFYEWLQRRALRRFDAVVAVSQPQVVELTRAGVPSQKLHLLRNAWSGNLDLFADHDARTQLRIPSDAFHVAWVGRLTREKGADVFVAAVAQLTDLPIAASIIGRGRELAALQAQARTLGCRDQIRWHGLLPNATRFFGGFDALVLSSRTEGTPIVLFEAMAAGIPIVATSVGGVPDVVTSSEAVLTPSDDPAALAAAIRSIYEAPAAAAARAAAARRRLEQEFAAAPWLAAYEQLYNSLVNSRTGSHV